MWPSEITIILDEQIINLATLGMGLLFGSFLLKELRRWKNESRS